MERKYFRTNCWQLITDEFIDKAAKNYHYSDDQYSLFKDIAWAVRTSIKDQEAAELLFYEDKVDVVFSLGKRLDLLIEGYSAKDKLLEALMATNIASALLMDGYRQFNDIAKQHFNSTEARLLFWGTPELPIDEMSEELKLFKHIQVSCNQGGNLNPTQSVVYRMVPSCMKIGMCDTCPIGLAGKCENKING